MIRKLSFLIVVIGLFISEIDQASAYPITVTGAIKYRDGDPRDTTPATIHERTERIPAKRVKVLLEAQNPYSFFGISSRLIVGVGHTDSQGQFRITANVNSGTEVAVKLEVENRFLHLWADTDCVDERLRANIATIIADGAGEFNLGTAVASPVYQRISVGHCLGFTFEPEVSVVGMLNINHVIQTSWRDADSSRDSSETDQIGQVKVEYCDNWSSRYALEMVLECSNSPSNASNIDKGMKDNTIAHEYAHHLQASIGNWDLHEGSHGFCDELDSWWWDDPEMAWSEGFARYFEEHIIRNYTDMSKFGKREIEHACSTGVDFSANDGEKMLSVEGLVAGMLWDIADELGSDDDAWDLIDGKRLHGHSKIISIFDRELDPSFSALSDAPDIRNFYKAWVDRHGTTSFELGRPALDAILSRFGIAVGSRSVFTPWSSTSLDISPNPSLGFIEPNPELKNVRSSYDRAQNLHRFNANYSFVHDKPEPISLDIGISNLNSINMLVIGPDGGGSETNAVSAEFSVRPVIYSPNGSPPWLVVSGSSSTTTTWPLSPNDLSNIELSVDPAIVNGFSRGRYHAEFDLVFRIHTSGGSDIVQNRTLVYELYVVDSATDDIDRDGLTNGEESMGCTSPSNRDTDGDGLSDGVEVNEYETDPCLSDTDGDGYDDYMETRASCFDPFTFDNASDPLSDPDNDGMRNEEEFETRTDPCDPDSDDDGVLDPDDNCPIAINPEQNDLDGDGLGNVCDDDADGDGVHRYIDRNDFNPNVGIVLRQEDIMRIQVPGLLINPLPLPFPPWCPPIICNPGSILVPNFVQGDKQDNYLRWFDSSFKVLDSIKMSDLGINRDEGLGINVVQVDDLDGDSRPEYAIAVPNASNSSGSEVGVVIVYSPGTGEIARIEGEQAGSRFGAAMQYLGDNLLAIGAPGSKHLPGWLYITNSYDLSVEKKLGLEQPGDRFATTFDITRSKNNDRILDLIVGAPDINNTGAIYRVHVATSDITLLSVGTQGSSGFGTVVKTISSNAEGEYQILVGAPNAQNERGEVILLHESGKLLKKLIGETKGERFGATILVDPFRTSEASSGFLVGSPGLSIGKHESIGGIKWFDKSLNLQFQLTGNRSLSQFGSSLAIGPDFNDYGSQTIIVGEKLLADNRQQLSSHILARKNFTAWCKNVIADDHHDTSGKFGKTFRLNGTECIAP